MIFKKLVGFFHRSLQFKFSFISGFLFVLIFGVSSAVIISQSVSFQKQSLLNKSRTYSKLATKPIGDSYNLYYSSGYFRFREQVEGYLDLNRDISRFQLISPTGKIIFDSVEIDSGSDVSSRSDLEDKAIISAVNKNKKSEFSVNSNDINQIIEPYSDDFGTRPFSIRYFVTYESVYESINQSIVTTLLLALVALIITLVSTTYLVHISILAPLVRIVQSAKEISHGNLAKVIKLESKDELGELAISLNQMTGKLKKNIEDLKQLDKMKDEFIFLASHNLRTPLTIIKGYTERLLESAVLGAEEKESLSKVSQSTKDLEATTESLLNLVALEKSNKPLIKKAVDLPDILRKAVNALSETAAEKKINFILELPGEGFPKIEADPQRLPQAFSGLVDNAIKFNKAGGKVTVRLAKKDNQALVSVSDTGIGIPEEEKDLIFKKFHRATDILTYNYEGIGLGLYLTKLIIEAHQGKIWFESKKGVGTTFYVEIPVKEELKEGLTDRL